MKLEIEYYPRAVAARAVLRVRYNQWWRAMKSSAEVVVGVVEEGDFAERVVAASRLRPVLVDFSAEWCAPCRAIEPVMARIAEEYAGRVSVLKVDADENMKLCGHYRLRGFPTVLLFVGGEEVDRFGGFKPTPQIREFLDRHL